MPNTRLYKRAFFGGELSSEMYGRIDDIVFQNAAAKVRNFIVTPQGPVENRSGFAYVNKVKNGNNRVRLLPFSYSPTQTMVIEMGAGYFRFHTQGSTLMYGDQPYEIVNPYAEADLFDIHYVQSADVMTLVHPSYRPKELRRLGATAWELKDIDISPPIESPAGVTVSAYRPASSTINADMNSTQSYKVTAVKDVTEIRESVPSLPASTSNALFITGARNTISWSAVSGATRYKVYKLTAGLYGYIGETDSLSLIDDNILPDLSKTPPIYETPFSNVGQITSVTVTNGGSGYGSTGGVITKVRLVTTATYGVNTAAPSAMLADPTGTGAVVEFHVQGVDLPGDNTDGWRFTGATLWAGGSGYSNPSVVVSDTPTVGGTTRWEVDFTPNTITFAVTDPGGGTGAEFEAVVRGGRITDVIVRNPGRGYSSATQITILDGQGGTGAVLTPVIGSTVDNPGAVAYFEQRRCFAGTKNKPQHIWMTRSGTESDMSYSVPLKDDDRISFRATGNIRHLVSLTQLLFLTDAAEWAVIAQSSDALTPTSISTRPQAYTGASNTQPVLVNNTVVYGAARGGHVRELSYSWSNSGFISADLSLRAGHLFEDRQILDMTYAKAPRPVIWMVSSSGELLGLTYIPEEKVAAWHRHDTDGVFESAAAVIEGEDDVLYAVVQRTINNQAVRFIERMKPRRFSKPEDAFFVDCGSTFDAVNYTARTMRLSGGTTWGADELLSLTASQPTFTFPGESDIGDSVVFIGSDGSERWLRIEAVLSDTVVRVRPDLVVPPAFRDTPVTSWAFARDEVRGLDWLEGKEVSVLANGAVHPRCTVTGGRITLNSPAYKVHVGLPYQSDLQTLPVQLLVEGGGQGRMKNVNAAWARVDRSSGIFIGPDPDHLVEVKQRTTEPYGSPPALKSQEIQLVLSPAWRDGGQVYIRQKDPLPLMIVNLTLEASVGA